ncbi:MAG TPA: bifunctional phosphoribosylaminoimidazolecarboxamide formyltransferase/IMP cyclohydrolase [Candidatus Limnocylindrales bacterium]|nr:bifunctional phosphoribosylaminoimidazolecarboxamide formyltransferase/IMP cyclohydrolase [Candidatus Limnocylindrales bacterium]
MSGRIVVCVSGEGTNLRALHMYAGRGLLGGHIVKVVADRPCNALGFAADEGIATALIPVDQFRDRDAWDVAFAAALAEEEPDLVVLAGFLRWIGPATLEKFRGRILNVHPSLLPAFPGRESIRDALSAGVKVTGVTVHVVDQTRDGGPILAQEAVGIRAEDSEEGLLARVHGVEHRLLPRVVASMLSDITEAALPKPRRALISVSDKSGLPAFARALVGLGFELVSTGGTAKALRAAGLEVTDVAEVTAFPEMLDGRVKTLHPRIAGGVLADWRNPDHRQQLAAAGIEPFELIVVNLYPFAEAAARRDSTEDELIEQIDIGGPTLVRAAAKNHANVGIVTDPAQYDPVLLELGHGGGLTTDMRRELAMVAFRLTSGYDALIAEELSRRWWHRVEMPGRLTVELNLVEQLRYGENPHQSAGLYRATGVDLARGAFAEGPTLLQGKQLSYNNILDTAAATGLARDLRGPACAIVKHANPCGVAEADDIDAAWDLALAGDPVSAFGGVVAVTRAIDASLAERLTSIFLEVVATPDVLPDALPILGRKPNLRVLIDPALGSPPGKGLELRSAGGAMLVTDADVAADDAATWTVATQRSPTDAEKEALDLAWRVCRHVKSNAIVLVKDNAVVGIGAGQMSRVDSARLAVAKAGVERANGAVCASDAFYPFPDALEVCAAAGVTAFVQPGGSQRDAEVIGAADAAGATMLVTGVRHFRH